jgi:hypothetical protein
MFFIVIYLFFFIYRKNQMASAKILAKVFIPYLLSLISDLLYSSHLYVSHLLYISHLLFISYISLISYSSLIYLSSLIPHLYISLPLHSLSNLYVQELVRIRAQKEKLLTMQSTITAINTRATVREREEGGEGGERREGGGREERGEEREQRRERRGEENREI